MVTSKVRMVSERKLRRLNNIIWILMLYYSFSSLAVHLFSGVLLNFYQAEFGDLFAVVSLFLTLLPLGLGFNQLANSYRECYLKLDKLNNFHSSDKTTQYYDILDNYPNHSDYDYIDFVVTHTKLYGKTLQDSRGIEIKPSKLMITSVVMRKLTYGVVVLFFLYFLLYIS